MSEKTESQGDRWKRVGGEYFLEDFKGIANKRSRRPDLHAFMLLDQLFPGDSDLVSSASHDEFFLDVGEDEVAKLTDDQIIELSRCGVRYSEFDCLCMFT